MGFVKIFTFLALGSYINAGTVCPERRFGPECANICHCTEGQACDPKGVCPEGCAPAWSGPSCQKENIAFYKPSHQKDGYSSLNSSLAVDDDATSCSATKSGVPGWWSVDLLYTRSIRNIRIVSNVSESIRGWRIHVGAEDNIFSMTLCTTISIYGNGASIRCDYPTKGRFVRVVNTLGPVIICEFNIFACPDQTYGSECNLQCGHCHDNQSCDQDTGHCRQGCLSGWTGQACNQACQNGFYGDSCAYSCGHCLNGTVCDKRYGICPLGCQAGWKGLFCAKECSPGQYGPNCESQCSQCRNTSCDVFNGTCYQGCAPGYHGDSCEEECPDGTYGQNCSLHCDHCQLGVTRSCDPVTGHCQHGCQPGFTGAICTHGCEGSGFYGVNCSTKCGVCTPGTSCDPVTGLCPEGCANGFYGNKCSESREFSDTSGPQLKIFLGLTISTVGGMMTAVILCLVYVWNREKLPSDTEGSAETEKLSSCQD